MKPLQGKYVMLHWKDPRWTLLAFLLGYCVLAIGSTSFTRTPEQFAAAVLTCVGLDFFLITFYKRVRLVPLSGLIAAMGTFLLTDSPAVWPYVAVGALAILSKHFIVVDRRHVFNPNNFGVVCMVLFFPENAMSEAGRWGGHTIPMIAISLLGLLAVVRAKRWVLSLTYVGTFGLGVLLRSYLFKVPAVIVAAPMTGAAFHLFIFYMISDPATSPKSRGGQFVFGVILAVMDSALRHMQFKYAPFVSLFVMCAVYSAFRAGNPLKANASADALQRAS